jgi:hypothetical protein
MKITSEEYKNFETFLDHEHPGANKKRDGDGYEDFHVNELWHSFKHSRNLNAYYRTLNSNFDKIFKYKN